MTHVIIIIIIIIYPLAYPPGHAQMTLMSIVPQVSDAPESTSDKEGLDPTVEDALTMLTFFILSTTVLLLYIVVAVLGWFCSCLRQL